MGPCEYNTQLGSYLDGELDAARRTVLEAHLRDCAACDADLNQLRGLSRLFATAGPMLSIKSLGRFHGHVSELEEEQYQAERTAYRILRITRAMTGIAACLLVAGSIWLVRAREPATSNPPVVAPSQASWALLAAQPTTEPTPPAASDLTSPADSATDWMMGSLASSTLSSPSPVGAGGSRRTRNAMIRNKLTNAVLMSLMLAFVSTLGAGVVVGFVASRRVPPIERPVPTTRPAEQKPLSLPEALGLNSEQKEKLKAIWTEIDKSRKGNFAEREKLLKDRDETLYNLLNDDQKQQYQTAMADYKQKLAELNKEREKAIQDAIERTKLMLDPAQRDKYEQILKEHGGFPHGDHDRPPRGNGQRGHNGPGRGPPHFDGEPRTLPTRGGPTTEELKDSSR